MVAGVVVVPRLLRGLGIDRFGLLSLAWILVGYFSLLDLASGRALTKFVSEKLALDEHHAIPALAWTSLLLMSALGILGGLLLFATSPILIYSLLKMPPPMQPEALKSFYVLATCIPAVTVASGLRGILEAGQHFRVASLIRIPVSVFSYVGPLLILSISRNLVAVAFILVIGRYIGAFAYLIACLRLAPVMKKGLAFERSLLPPLLKLGGWMTISNIASPLLFYVDRFVIGAVLSMSAVTYYTTPFDVVTRIWVLPWAICGVLFPAFALTIVKDRDRTELLFQRGVKYIFIAIFPLALIIILFSPEALEIWLGQPFATHASSVLRWLAIGVFINSLACIPFTLLQGGGRADIPAKLQLLQLPLYAAVLVLLLRTHGIEGAAFGWTARVALESILYFVCSRQLLPQSGKFLFRLGVASAAALLGFYAATLPKSLFLKSEFASGSVLALGFMVYCSLAPDERRFVFSYRGKARMADESLRISQFREPRL
jgi:O-antigen/teichoic acid export membrane protein